MDCLGADRFQALREPDGAEVGVMLRLLSLMPIAASL